jgi:uncharacterized Zn finger protein (UPF0148 family)
MSEQKPTVSFCPNCQQPAIRTGNEIYCEKCDTTFVFTEKKGAVVKQLGPLERVNERLDRIEQLLASKAGSEVPPPEPAPEIDEENDII